LAKRSLPLWETLRHPVKSASPEDRVKLNTATLTIFMKTHLILRFVVASLFSTVIARAGADNVIVFIGDGMGFNHVKAGRAVVNGNTAAALGLENLGVAGSSITKLPDGTITDSATAGTALATGYQHPVNGIISMGYDYSIKTSILEIAKAKGMRTGIITTDDIGGATPGAFGAHEPDRNLMADIRYDYIWDDTTYHHLASLPNILLGGGYNDPAIISSPNLTYVGLAQLQNYQCVFDYSSLLAATVPNNRLIGLFCATWTPMTGMAYRTSSTQPTLSQMVNKALSQLQNPNGFFLMVESANIDKFSHSNDRNFVFEVSELDLAVQAALAWKNAHLSENTLILVTADHETGGVSVPDQTITPGTVPTINFSSTGHTTANVPIFATWPAGLNGLTLDNTEVFNLMEDFVNFSTGGKPPVIDGLAVSGITETGATFQWSTTEPSTSELLVDGHTSQNPTRSTAHVMACTDLLPGTPYDVTVGSTDLGGFQGTATISFTTKLSDFNAKVAGEPVVTIGSVSGTAQGVTAPDDGEVQTFTEVPSGAGSRVEVLYTLHSPAGLAEIDALTIQGKFSWTQQDAADPLVMEIRARSPGGDIWQPITLPFQAAPVSSYMDETGNVAIRFTDSASIRRERKDVLTVDYLLGQVTLGSTAPVVPPPANLQVTGVSSSSVTLSWTDSANATGYYLWRYTSTAGWTIAAQLSENATTVTDSDLIPGTDYTYVVRAFNAEAYADSAFVRVTTAEGLLAPTNLKASVAKGTINLAWTDNNTLETGYQILRGNSVDDFAIIATVGFNVTAYADKTVVRGTTYYYQVSAIYGANAGPVSSTVSVVAR
jgi:alkaline phosphatase